MLWVPGKENSSAFKPFVRFGFMLETYTLLCPTASVENSRLWLYSVERGQCTVEEMDATKSGFKYRIKRFP